MPNIKVFYGLYDGQVCSVNDPENRGRIQCIIPEVTGESPSAWCEPCIPVAYDGGGDFYLPKLKEFVWIMFEQGNPNKPVYLGGWWSENKTPLGKQYQDRKSNERIINFFGTFIKMLKEENKIEIGVNEEDPEIVIEEGTVRIKGWSPSGGSVNDVIVNGRSVVTDNVARLSVPTKTSELLNDCNFEENVQGDWEETDNTKDSFIKNKMESLTNLEIDAIINLLF